MGTAEEIATEALRLAFGAGLPLVVVLGLLLVSAVVLVVGRKIRWPAPPPPEVPPPAAEPWQTDAEHPGGPGGGG